MSNKVRVGLVGTSWYADMIYLPALRSHPQAEVAALCGRDQSRAGELAAKYNVPRVFSDYREMIAAGELDAVIVAVPDDLHYAVTLAALAAGRHVLCEKPLAGNTAQAHEMYTAAQAAGVKHMVAFTYRWMPFFQYAHDLIAQGVVGRLYHAEFRYLSGFARGGEYAWRYDGQRANGILGDLGAHMIDLARWLVGEITQVSAQLGVFVERPGAAGGPRVPANDSAMLMVEFAHGAHGLIQASGVAQMADRGMQQQVTLYGQAGSLEITVPYWGSEAGAVLRVARAADAPFETLAVPAAYWGAASPADPFGIFTQLAVGSRLFIDAILEDRPVTPDFHDGYQAQRVIDAALEAHRTGRRVTLA